MQDRWNYIARDERNPSRPAIWYLQDSDPPLKVVRRGAFFDAERENFILGRFAGLEEAQHCVETDAERVRIKRPRELKQMPD